MMNDESTQTLHMKACKVFGDVIVDNGGGGVNESLYYSPSPREASQKQIPFHDELATVLFETNQVNHDDSKHVNSRCELDGVEKENTHHRLSMEQNSSSICKEELSRLRATSAQSPLRRERATNAQLAITIATETVNKSLNVSRKGTKNSQNNQAKNNRKVRFQWKEDYAEAKSFNESLEARRRQILDLQRDLSSKHFKERARKQREQRKKHLEQVQENYMFKSEVFREHQRKLKEEEDNRRRKSQAARAKIRENNRKGENRLKQIREAEEAAIMECRHDTSLALRETNKQKALQRKKSFSFRGGDARRIRDLRATWKTQKLIEQSESYELERQAAKDVDNYKTAIEKSRRESLAFRNREARRIREQELKEATAFMDAEHASYELKWAGERDAADYQKMTKEERRKSIANRNKESKRHAEVMKELETIAKEKETESFLLKWAGDDDAKAYLAKLAEERKKSLQLRGEESKRILKYEREKHDEEVNAALAEGALQSACQKDIEKYKKECAERKRKSLEFRGKEATVQRIEANARALEEQQVASKNFQLESLARKDVEAYLEECKASRRKSLAARAKEKRRHAQWQDAERERELQERNRSTQEEAWDRRHMELAKQRERAEMAMNALRDAGCDIVGNPFADILNI